jgi:Fe-S cluster biosynthesis and repair protein YggX
MSAVKKVAVFNRLEVQLGGNVRGAPPVPAEAVPRFRRNAGRFAHDLEYTTRALQYPVMSPCAPGVPPEPSRNQSGRIVHCVKFQKDLPGLDTPPWPGELGKRIYENVSLEAWRMWEDRMKMILNEYRLLPFQKEAQELVAKHMEDFFFGEGAALPPGYVPQQAK